jgi:hypothetical protein
MNLVDRDAASCTAITAQMMVTLSSGSPTNLVTERLTSAAWPLIEVSHGLSDRPPQKDIGLRPLTQLTPAALHDLNAINAIDHGLLADAPGFSGLQNEAHDFR